MEMASRKIQTYQNKAKNLHTIYFVYYFYDEFTVIVNILFIVWISFH